MEGKVEEQILDQIANFPVSLHSRGAIRTILDRT